MIRKSTTELEESNSTFHTKSYLVAMVLNAVGRIILTAESMKMVTQVETECDSMQSKARTRKSEKKR